MKKLLIAGLLAAVLPTVALAKGGNHPMAGCGLGYVLFGNNDNSQVMQILAATTNGTFGTQTFGITSGTSGCTEDGAVKFVKEAEVYAEVNLKDLSRDMAKGRGDYLTAFARLVGVSSAQEASFGALVRQNYVVLFPSSETSSVDMLTTLASVLGARRDLLS